VADKDIEHVFRYSEKTQEHLSLTSYLQRLDYEYKRFFFISGLILGHDRRWTSLYSLPPTDRTGAQPGDPIQYARR
jgi:hypothetical protein